MDQVFCTLFDSNYIDKGLTLYDSLVEVSNKFKLYILAMDDRCYDVLSSLNYEHIVLIKLLDFENEDLLSVKKVRSVGEYCWTCSSSLIKYVIATYKPDYCTYIDADIYFYSDPICIIDEMKRKNASVQITGHRFYDDVAVKSIKKVGRYCVEFNTFKNDENANWLLDYWVKQCLEYCSIDGDGIHWGDQKYLDNWVDDFPFVIETEHLGAGVAPWNLAKYRIESENDMTPLNLTCEGVPCTLLFYHFENITYLERKKIKLNVFGRNGIQSDLVYKLYIPYLLHIDRNKEMLRTSYLIDLLIRRHPGESRYNIFTKAIINIKKIIKRVLFPNGYKNYLSYKQVEVLDIINL